jgi:DNA ligase D-like protein (predicted 3'-phosphoesterase)
MSPLQQYRHKRDFRVTSEPRGGPSRRRRKGPLFVIQKHDASRLHYDFRLEVGGVLKSWAVPKGPSTNPRDKRLAVAVEDHPLEYAEFEGVIPEGQYGAGTVIVWDIGWYRNITERDGKEVPIEQGIEDGHVSVWLEGKKLRGGWSLTRFRAPNQWLLVKRDDEMADPQRQPTETQPESVISGRTNDDLKEPAR